MAVFCGRLAVGLLLSVAPRSSGAERMRFSLYTKRMGLQNSGNFGGSMFSTSWKKAVFCTHSAAAPLRTTGAAREHRERLRELLRGVLRNREPPASNRPAFQEYFFDFFTGGAKDEGPPLPFTAGETTSCLGPMAVVAMPRDPLFYFSQFRSPSAEFSEAERFYALEADTRVPIASLRCTAPSRPFTSAQQLA